jgi:hypothetical protein
MRCERLLVGRDWLWRLVELHRALPAAGTSLDGPSLRLAEQRFRAHIRPIRLGGEHRVGGKQLSLAHDSDGAWRRELTAQRLHHGGKLGDEQWRRRTVVALEGVWQLQDCGMRV